MFLSTKPIRASMDEALQEGQEVILVTLGTYGGNLIKAFVVDCSVPLLRMRTTIPVVRNTPVKVEGNDILLLGEVCGCEREGEDYWILIRFSEMLKSLAALASSLQALQFR
jgi:hypothetical protein